MNPVELTKKLIFIPSFVDERTDEGKIGEFLYGYLKRLAWLKVIRQPVVNGRFNIIAYDKYPPSLLFCGHMDTVQPKRGWQFDQFKGMEIDGKIYGLGASDMKSNLAALLCALANFRETKGLMVLLYIDEEYDFLGMKKFIEEYRLKVKPKLIISLDGGNLHMGNGCRGLIEASFFAQGKTGHAARPESGKNAILRSSQAIEGLTSALRKNYSRPELGATTVNLAYLRGGLNLGKDKNGNLLIGKEGNNIADIAEFVLDVRPTTEKLNANKLIQLMRNYLKQEGLKLQQAKIRHDFSSWLTPKSLLKDTEKVIAKTIPVEYANLGKIGYIDTQLLWKAFGKISCFTFGAGEEQLAHKPNEYVRVANLNKCQEIVSDIICEFCNGR